MYSTEPLAKILDQCPIGVAIVGTALGIRCGNPRFVEMTALGTRSWPSLDRMPAGCMLR